MPQAIPFALAAAQAIWAAAAAYPIIASAVVTAGLTAAQYALARAQKGGDDVSPLTSRDVNSPESRLTVRESTPVHQIIIGETRFSGALAFPPVNNAPKLIVQWLHGVLPVTSFDKLYIGETLVSIDADGYPLSPPYIGKMRVVTQTGALDQPVNPLLATELGYDADYRLPGIPNTAAWFDFGTNEAEHRELWEGGLPNLSWIGKGVPLPNPNNPTHTLDFDPHNIEELHAAIETWDWSNTAANAQLFWLLIHYGMNAGTDKINWAASIPQINFDNETVALFHRGGFEKRHTVDAFILLDQSPMQVMESMLTANGGHIAENNGKLFITSGLPKEPLITITDGHLVGPMTFRNALPIDKKIDLVRGAFVASERGYSDGEMSWPQSGVADRPKVQSPRLGCTVGAPRAARIFKAHYDRSQLGKHIGIVCDRRCLGLKEGDVFRYDSTRYTRRNGLYQVEAWDYSGDRTSVAYAASEYDPLIGRAWVPSEHEPEYPTSAELEAA